MAKYSHSTGAEQEGSDSQRKLTGGFRAVFLEKMVAARLCTRPVTAGENGLVVFFGMRAYSLNYLNIPPFFIPIQDTYDFFISHGYTRMKHGCIVAQASSLCLWRKGTGLQTCHQCLRLDHGCTCSTSFQLVSEIRMLLIEKMSLFASLRLSVGDATTSVISRSLASGAGSTPRRRNFRIKQNALLIVRSRRGAGRAENAFRWNRFILSKTGFFEGINKIYGISLLRPVGQEALYPCGEEHPGSGNS